MKAVPQPGTSAWPSPIRKQPLSRSAPGSWLLVKFGVGIGAGRLGDGQGKIVAGGLLGRHDQ